ncbi:MAG: GNAT family N-acetyltransferase [Propionibacteriaceae bacterium]|nr:GNAT family N-acetyltransferase [Propionibacteriaceae bacterium]
MQEATRSRIDGHWSRRFGVPVPGLHPVTVSGSGRHDDAALVLLLGDHAYVDAPLAHLDALAPLALAHAPATLLDAATWAPVATGTVLGPADHFWADHETALPANAEPLDPADRMVLAGAVDDAEWHEAGFDRDPHACFGIVEDGRLVAASVLTSLWGWPVDVGVLVAPDARGRGLGTRVAGAALAAGVGLSGFAAFRAARDNIASRRVAARLGLEAYGANLAVPLG